MVKLLSNSARSPLATASAAAVVAATLFFAPPFASSALAAECIPVPAQEAGPATVQRCGKIALVYLRGNPVERARQLGRLLRGPLSSEVVDYFSQKVPGASGPFSGLATLTYNQLVRLQHRNVPVGLAEEVDALAASMGVDSIFLKRAISLPDTAAAINVLGSAWPFKVLPAAGCTSVVLKRESRFLVGRNLDFAGVGSWDKHPMIALIQPEAGSEEIPHLIFGADGALFGGITGVNQAGISFAVHQSYSSDGSSSGIPMMFIGELVLRSARSLAEAEEILRRHRPSFLWTFVVTDLKTGEAMAVNSSSKNFFVRRMSEETFVQTNHVMHEDLRQAEYISIGTKLNSIYRMEVAGDLLGKISPPGRPDDLARILSHQGSTDGGLSAYHDILKAHTLQTVLLESQDGKPGRAWLSQDEAPAGSGTYLSFSLDELFSAPARLTYQEEDPLATPPETRARQREVAEAFHSYFDLKDISSARAKLAGHQTLDGALFRSVTSYQLGNFREAEEKAASALSDPRFTGEPAHIRQSVLWVQMNSLWQQSKKAEARNLAVRLETENPVNKRLAAAAQRLAAGRDPSSLDLRMGFEFFSGDLSGRAD